MEFQGQTSEWSELYDELSGQNYFYNTVTWEVSWEPPSTIKKEENEISDAEKQKQALEDYYKEIEEPEWIEEFDESSNSVYYFNTVTGESSWEIPEAIAALQQQVSSEEPIIAPSAEVDYGYYDENGEYAYNYDADPQYWTSAYDEGSGMVYYYNTATEVTQWDVPACFQVVAEDSSLNTSSVESKKVQSTITSHIPFQDSNQTSSNVTKSPGNAKRSKRHSISGPMQGKLDLFDADKSKTSYHSSAVELKRPSPAQFFPKDKISNILKYSKTHDTTSSSSPSSLSPLSSPSPVIKLSSDSNDIDHHQHHQHHQDNTGVSVNNSDAIISIIDLTSLSPSSLIEQITKIVNGLSLVDYIKTQHMRSISSLSSIDNKNIPQLNMMDISSSYTWSPHPIMRPILNLSSNDEVKVAKKCHRYILHFMESTDTSSSSVAKNKAADLSMKLLSCAKHWIHQHPTSSISNEIYLHISKQLINNPAVMSTQRGWLLLQLCLATFLPSLDCLPYILSFCLDAFLKLRQDMSSHTAMISHAMVDDHHSNNQQPLSRAVASALLCCLKAIEFISDHISSMKENITINTSCTIMNSFIRHHLPSSTEIQSLWSGTMISLPVHLLIPDRNIIISCDSYTTIKTINRQIAMQLGIYQPHHTTSHNNINHLLSKNSNHQYYMKDELMLSFSLFEVNGHDEQCLPIHDRLVDVISPAAFISSSSSASSYKLVYKIRYYLDNMSTIHANSIMRDLYYYQAVYDVLTLKYPIFEYDAYILAAYHAYVMQTSPSTSSDYLNSSFILDKTSSEVAKIKKTIDVAYHHAMMKLSSIESIQLAYLTTASSWKLYGTTTFTVESRTELGTPSVQLLAIGCDGITLVHIESKAFLASYRYHTMLSWGHSHNFFLIVSGNKSQPNKQYFKTRSGKDIDQVVSVYVQAYRKRLGKDHIEDESLLQPIVFEKSIFSVNAAKLQNLK